MHMPPQMRTEMGQLLAHMASPRKKIEQMRCAWTKYENYHDDGVGDHLLAGSGGK